MSSPRLQRLPLKPLKLLKHLRRNAKGLERYDLMLTSYWHIWSGIVPGSSTICRETSCKCNSRGILLMYVSINQNHANRCPVPCQMLLRCDAGVTTLGASLQKDCSWSRGLEIASTCQGPRRSNQRNQSSLTAWVQEYTMNLYKQ